VRRDLVIVHLYPDLLRTYGDRGNILALQRRAEWRGFTVDVREVLRGQRMPAVADVVLIGGGSDRAQEALAEDLASHRTELEAVASEGAVIGVCGGYQFLGHRYVTLDGASIEGLGLLDVETVAEEDRIIGDVRAKAVLWDRCFDLVGFENHGGRTRLGPGAKPLGTTEPGRGNNGVDGTEGAVQGGVIGTYLHGPVLPANPPMADAILERVLFDHGGGPLPPLDDAIEIRAREEARHRVPPR